MLARGLASESRNAAVVAGVHADRARELEDAARAEESHEVALTEARGRLVLAAIERGYVDLGLPEPREFVRELLRGWPGPVDPEIVERAREEVRRPIRGEIRAELLAEVGEARRALPPGEDEQEQDGEEEVDGEVVHEEAETNGSPESGLPLEAFIDEEDGPEWLHRASERKLAAERGEGDGARMAGWAPSIASPLRASPRGGSGGLV
jgi:hypothetical protein